MRIYHYVTAAIVTAVASAASADVLLGDFENSLLSPLGTWSGSGNVALSYSGTTGVSSGSSSLVVQRSAQGFDWSLALNGNEPLRDAILANDKLAMDVTMVTGPLAPPFPYSVFLASLNSATTGWQQATANLTSSSGENGWNTDKVTFIWDYPQTAMNASSPWSQINIATNLGNITGPVPAIHIDNIRLIAVPEPATLSAVAGVVALGLRRRR